jgi:3-hydroxyacyl-CoA dehydrogenase/enoyl-CoA hydratase/3-hydroxybutyryl-CoA epimerase
MLVLSNQPRRPLPFMQKLLNGPLKSVVANGAKKQVAQRARQEHYPAPYAIIDIWAKYNGNALAAPELVDGIVRSPTARNLVRVFFLQERLKSFGKDVDWKAQARARDRCWRHGGRHRRLVRTARPDRDAAGPEHGAHRAGAEACPRGFAKRIKDKLQLRAVMDRLIPDPEGQGAAHADVVIEAIFENVEAKHALFKKLDAVMKPDAVLATNTSSLKLEDLRTVLKNPARLVGIHFFNPVSKMPLVEVVSAEGGDPEMAKKAAAFVKQIDRLPLPVKSAPGFLVNAVLGPYMLEALRAVDEGNSPETVDEAMLAFGMPMGPIELVDMVGLDVAMAAGKALAGSGAEPPKCLVERFNAGNLGKKTGKGFYDHSSGKPAKGAPGSVPAGLAARLVKPLLDKTQKLVDEGIVADADLADAGVIFGTGFAPFTGGPLNYAKNLNG